MCCRCSWKLVSELGPGSGGEVFEVFVESPWLYEYMMCSSWSRDSIGCQGTVSIVSLVGLSSESEGKAP